MRASISQLDEISMTDREIYYTPEIQIWLSDKKVKKDYRKKLFDTLDQLVIDIKEVRKPRVGRIKIIEKCQVPIFYLRLTNEGKTQRLLFDYKYEIGSNNKVSIVKIWLLAIANKKDVQSKLSRSADHKVHSTSLTRLDWFPEGNEDGEDLSKISSEELVQYRERCKKRFANLSKDQIKNGWTEEIFNDRSERASTWELRFPSGEVNLDDEEYDLPRTLRLQGHQKELFRNKNRYFLLEGVAGTGKTTILVYKFVNDVKLMFKEDIDVENEAVFVTLNDRLRDEIRDLISVFFTPDQQKIVDNCILSYDDLIKRYIPKQKLDKFNSRRKLTREKFRSVINESKVDKDLIWEEYRGLLRGYNLHSSEWIISKSSYEKEGKKRGRVTKEQRQRVYNIILDSEDELKNDYWDDVDVGRILAAQIKNNHKIRRLRLLYVDEVQDFTAADIDLMLLLMNQKGVKRVAMAGDLSQSVYPSSFTWPSLSELIYKRHQVKPEKGAILKENYRSTPYLVEAANIILNEQGEYDVLNSSPSLQRPFSGENTGEPVLVMMGEDEKDLMDEMIKQGLPNAFCLLLVRDEIQKQQIVEYYESQNNQDKKTEELTPFIETIAEYKGAEMKSILLWQPTKGTQSLLDRISDEKRGKYVKESDETVKNSILFELRHLFVGITRARYLLGILSTKSAYLLNKCEEKVFSLYKSNISEKLSFFTEGDLTQEDHLEQARNFVRARKYKMAAQSYRNANREHEFHYNMGLHHEKDNKLDKAVLRFDDAIKTPGVYSEKAKQGIAKISDEAIEQGKENDTRGIKSKVLINASKYLDEDKLSYLEAEISYEEEDFVKAAIFYHKAKKMDNFSQCINKVNPNERLNLAFQTRENKLARAAIVEILDGKKGYIIDYLLGTRNGIKIATNILANFEDSPFKRTIVNFYRDNPDFIYSKSIANTIKNEKSRVKRIDQIAKRELALITKENGEGIAGKINEELEIRIESLITDLAKPSDKLKLINKIEWSNESKRVQLLLEYHKNHSSLEDFFLHLMKLIKEKESPSVISAASAEIAEKIKNLGKKSRTNISTLIKSLQNDKQFLRLIPDDEDCIKTLVDMQNSEIIQEIYRTAVLIKILEKNNIVAFKASIDKHSKKLETQSLKNFFILITNLIVGININKHKFSVEIVFKNVLKMLTSVVKQGSLETMMLFSLIPYRWPFEESKNEMVRDINSYSSDIKFNEETLSNRKKKMMYARTFFSVEDNTPMDYVNLPEKFKITDLMVISNIYIKMKENEKIIWTDNHTVPMINLSKIYSKISTNDKWLLKKLREKKFSILMDLYDKNVKENNTKFKNDFVYLKHSEFGEKSFLINYEDMDSDSKGEHKHDHTETDEKIITEIALSDIEDIQNDAGTDPAVREKDSIDEEENLRSNSSELKEIELQTPDKVITNERDSSENIQLVEEDESNFAELEDLSELSVEVSKVEEESLIPENLYLDLSSTDDWKNKLFNPVIRRFLTEILEKASTSIEKAQTVRTLVKDLAMIEASKQFPNHFKALLSIRLFDYKGFADENGNVEKTYGKELYRNMLKEMVDAGKSEIKSMDRSKYPIYAQTILTSNIDFYSN